jgi:hypothetical protein
MSGSARLCNSSTLGHVAAGPVSRISEWCLLIYTSVGSEVVVFSGYPLESGTVYRPGPSKIVG